MLANGNPNNRKSAVAQFDLGTSGSVLLAGWCPSRQNGVERKGWTLELALEQKNPFGNKSGPLDKKA